MAQVAAYEVIDLGALPSSADPKSGAWAINDRHEVVGWAIDPLFQTHAALWLYCPNYGLAAGRWHDLTVMGGETEFGEAFDINMSGLVVGRQTVSTSNGWTRGYIWDVGASPLVTTELGTFTGGAATEGLPARSMTRVRQLSSAWRRPRSIPARTFAATRHSAIPTETRQWHSPRWA